MYEASIAYCAENIGQVEFVPAKLLESLNSGKTTVQAAMKKIISRYFSLFDSEPLFKMYVFVHSEQYFNVNALKIVQNQNEKIAEDIKGLLASVIKNSTDKDIKDIACACTNLILAQLDAYIAVRKETIRQNPETGAGSLFELPSDNNIINRASKLVESLLAKLL